MTFIQHTQGRQARFTLHKFELKLFLDLPGCNPIEVCTYNGLDGRIDITIYCNTFRKGSGGRLEATFFTHENSDFSATSLLEIGKIVNESEGRAAFWEFRLKFYRHFVYQPPPVIKRARDSVPLFLGKREIGIWSPCQGNLA
jgi:hypothetical protein